MYDEITCRNCGFNPKEQETKIETINNEYISYHWETTYHNEYFPSIDQFKSWETIQCPVCGTTVHSTL